MGAGYRGQGSPSLAGGRPIPRCGGEGLCCRVTVLFQEDMVGLVEPINSRITDPRYFLNTPQQGKVGTAPCCLLRGRQTPCRYLVCTAEKPDASSPTVTGSHFLPP